MGIGVSNKAHMERVGRIVKATTNAWTSGEHISRVIGVATRFSLRVTGKKGAKEAEARFVAGVSRITSLRTGTERIARTTTYLHPKQNHWVRHNLWKQAAGLKLAELAGQGFDSHLGWERGDNMSTSILDFVEPVNAKGAPFCDMGDEGLALVMVRRRRVYASSYKFGPSEAATVYLVGRNEAGTYFAHPVSRECASVESAVNWIWGGKADMIVRRQGDIALIAGNGGPTFPSGGLPFGHRLDADRGVIWHETHPDLPVPVKGGGQRIIVGRRAHVYVSEATRD